MKLIDTPYKIKCELGVCKNLAKKTVTMDRVGARGNIHVCPSCMRELYNLIGKEITPAPVETLKKSRRRKTDEVNE